MNKKMKGVVAGALIMSMIGGNAAWAEDAIISNVADGIAANDAVTVGQLNAATTSLSSSIASTNTTIWLTQPLQILLSTQISQRYNQARLICRSLHLSIRYQ